MGYTRYWKVNKYDKFSDEFMTAVKDAIWYAENKCRPRIKIGDINGEGKAEITPHYIAFNGDASVDNDYESFVIECTEPQFNFCKTARLPYDAVVNAVLRIARDYGYVYDVSSDGPNDNARAKRIYKYAMRDKLNKVDE